MHHLFCIEVGHNHPLISDSCLRSVGTLIRSWLTCLEFDLLRLMMGTAIETKYYGQERIGTEETRVVGWEENLNGDGIAGVALVDGGKVKRSRFSNFALQTILGS